MALHVKIYYIKGSRDDARDDPAPQAAIDDLVLLAKGQPEVLGTLFEEQCETPPRAGALE